jgi:hypothetical protein
LEQLLLVDALLGEQRLMARSDRALAGCGDSQRDAAHFAQPRDDAIFRVGLHDPFNHFAGLISGSILEKRHGDLEKIHQPAVQNWRFNHDSH